MTGVWSDGADAAVGVIGFDTPSRAKRGERERQREHAERRRGESVFATTGRR